MLQKVSRLIKEEKFTQASTEIKRYRSLVDEVFAKKETKKDLDKFNGRIEALEKVMASKQRKKGGKGGMLGKGSSAGKGAIGMKGPKSVKIAKKSKKALPMAGKGKGKGKGAMVEESEEQDMASDSEEEVLYREMRARS